MSEDCIFCKIANREIPKEIIYENDNFMSFLDISPVIKGHGLIISKKHFKTILDLPNNLGPELLECIKETSLKLINETNTTGFNVHQNNNRVAGQIVDHIHFHILPRNEGDGLRTCV